jgi:LysR family transcriptional regulator, glycine cleavage system transcriptional activator
MSYRLPPLNGLRAFESSARHLSFKRAADELCVTPGAVSQQVKALEALLGVDLFRRLPRGLLLTAAGEDYLPPISQAFRAISDATERTAPALGGRRLKLGVAPAIKSANYPALKGIKKHDTTALRVTVVTTEDLEQLLDGRLDAVLRPMARRHPGLHLDPIELRTPDGAHAPATLFTLPGLAGCREHRALVKLLQG